VGPDRMAPAAAERAYHDQEHPDQQCDRHEDPDEGPVGATRRRVLATCLHRGRRFDRPPALTHAVMIWVRWVPVGGSRDPCGACDPLNWGTFSDSLRR